MNRRTAEGVAAAAAAAGAGGGVGLGSACIILLSRKVVCEGGAVGQFVMRAPRSSECPALEILAKSKGLFSVFISVAKRSTVVMLPRSLCHYAGTPKVSNYKEENTFSTL